MTALLAVLFVAAALVFVVPGFGFVVDGWVDTFKAGRDLWRDDKP